MTVSVIRTVILYVLLMAAMRLMGKRQLGELQPSELVVTLLLSDLAAVPMQENGLPLFNGVLPILVLVALELFVSGLMLKSSRFSRLIAGTPQAVIRDGRLQEKVMRRLRMTVDDLTESLRQQNIFDLRQVQYAIAETNGHISVYSYPRFQAATVGDVKSDPPEDGMPVVVVSDGVLSDWGLQLCGLDRVWVYRLLGQKGYAQEQVFLLTATKEGNYYLVTYDEVGGDKG
ncbi:MAG: DUF421 domain-containing protein [Clostridia bacterium]|nr:DUF421 domain-containing protein [Clostridia bacterium]